MSLIYPRRITSSATNVTVYSTDGTIWATPGGVTPGSIYKGNETFTALTAVRDSISSSGGWSQLPNTIMYTAAMSNAELSAVGPLSQLKGVQYPNQWFSWGSAAFNGYGFFFGAVGNHSAGNVSDFYMMRLADPVGVIRMQNCPPTAAIAYGTGSVATRFPDSYLVPRADWTSLRSEEVKWLFPEFGPKVTHNYTSFKFDPVSEKILFGGSNTVRCLNPMEEGSIAVTDVGYWMMDINAPTPKSAWTHNFVTSGTGGIYSAVDNGDNTFSFRFSTQYSTPRYTINTVTGAVTSGVHKGPTADGLFTWRPTFRDPATDKYYEIHRKTISTIEAGNYSAIYDVSGGSLLQANKVADIPIPQFGDQYQDAQGCVVVVNGYAYCWVATSTVARINLATGASETYTDSTTITRAQVSWAGIWDWWAYVPQAGCFVGVSSDRVNAYVFRPPSTWGL
jgi:hypothetical protein